MAIAEDASTPAVKKQAQGTSGTCTSASFSPPSNTLVVVIIAWMFAGTGSHAGTLSVKDSLNNSYASGVELDNVQETTTAIFSNYYTTGPGSITVTATCTNTASASVLMAVRVLTGAAQLQNGNTVSDSNDGHFFFTTSVVGSWSYAVGGAPNSARAPTAEVNFQQIDQYRDTGGTGNQSAFGKIVILPHWVGTSVPGKMFTGWSANIAQACAMEILPAAAPILGNAGQAGPQWQTGQVLAAADVNAWLIPLAQQKLNPTSRTLAALAVDPDLQLPLVGAGNWAFRLAAFFDGPSTVNFKWSWFSAPGATTVMSTYYYNGSNTLSLENHSQPDQVSANLQGVGTPQAIAIDGMVQTPNPGTLSFLWCPSANTTNAAPVTLYQGSYIIGWRQG